MDVVIVVDTLDGKTHVGVPTSTRQADKLRAKLFNAVRNNLDHTSIALQTAAGYTDINCKYIVSFTVAAPHDTKE